MCVSKPMCSCQLNQFLGVDMSCQVWTLCKAFRKWNGFGDDVVAEQPSHPCLVVFNAMSHVTPCVFLSSEPWLKHCAFNCLFFFLSSNATTTQYERITTHNTQDNRLWRSTNSGVNGGKHDHDKWCGHTVFHGTRDGHWHQALHWCCGCVQLWHHGCSGDGWSSCL